MNKNNSDASFPIVAIGASAGGLHPLQCFIAALPGNFGFSVVFMQHLSTKHKSLLAGLLNKSRPDLDIKEVSEGLELLPSKVYICPPGVDVTIRQGAFHIETKPESKVHLSIGDFFSSIAQAAGERAIGVVLSGAGTDGAIGVREIRTMGGTVFVQDPLTAEFTSMPLAAIATGRVDAVLAPEEIALEILKMHDAGTTAAGPEDLITPSQFGAFYRLLRDKAGYDFSLYKKNVVGRRISRRMYLRGTKTVTEYLKFISENVTEINGLASDLMIGVTSFFRDPLAWKALKTGVIRKLAAVDNVSPVRVWTPASATGEEAYSIAMMLHHELELAGKRREIQVFATDVNERALEKAREGKYPAGICSEISPDLMKKYLTYTEDGLFATISKEIRGLVVFAKHDILIDPPFSHLDLVICRNLLIYLEPEAQEKCIALFHYGLKHGGFLFLGNAESPGRNISFFKSLAHKKCRIYEKVETRMPVPGPFASERPEPFISPQKAEEPGQSVTGIIQEALLEKYAPAAVAVDQSYNILYHNGPTNRYLCQPRGAPTQNLLELLPANLRSRVRGALYKTSRDGRHVSIRTKVPCDDGQKREVTLGISQIRQDLFLFVFRERGAASEPPEETCLEASAIEETAVRQIENELAVTKQDLQSNIEQLKGLNEEMQSSNEELQAANEELETSREELQSLNEEMITVNAQLQSKIEEQEITNNNLNNFLSSTNIPTLFLDQHTRVRLFTPAMSRLIKLIPADIGRPIIDMSQDNLGPDLISDAQDVLEQLVPIKKELLINAAWYVRAVLPYRTADNRIEGVVITYSDITDMKAAEERTRHLASFPELNPSPVIEVASSGKVIYFNHATQKVLEDLGMDTEDISVLLPADLDDILSDLGENKTLSFYREIVLKDRVFGETIHLVPKFDVVRIYASDITRRTQSAEKLLRSEKQYRELFENMVEGCAYCKMVFENEKPQDFIYLSVNNAFETLTGLKNVAGKRVTEVIPGIREADPELMEIYGRVSLSGSPERFEMFVEALKMWFSVSVYSPEKEFFVAVFDIITERKHAEQSIQRLNESLEMLVTERTRFYSVLAKTNEAIARTQDRRSLFDEVCRIIVENGQFKLVWVGILDPESRAIMPAASFGEKTYLEDLRIIAADVPEGKGPTGRAVYEDHYIINTDFEEDPRLLPWREKARAHGLRSSSAFPLHTGGQVVGALTIYSDKPDFFNDQEISLLIALAKNLSFALDSIETETKRSDAVNKLRLLNEELESRVHKRTSELEDANRELESFIYSVSHDLRAPLRSMSSFARFLIEDYTAVLDDQGRDYLLRINRGATKMSALINDLLDLSKLSRQELSRREVDISALAASIVSGLREADTGRDVKISIEDGLIASADPSLLEIVLSNLIGNAWKFTSKTAMARIEFGILKNRPQHLSLKGTVYYMRDNGAGFDPEYAAKMFLPFHRLHSSEDFEGTGIGLAIVERIIRKHNGNVWSEGEIGKGATVYFTLG